jgi:hypothetical protein
MVIIGGLARRGLAWRSSQYEYHTHLVINANTSAYPDVATELTEVRTGDGRIKAPRGGKRRPRGETERRQGVEQSTPDQPTDPTERNVLKTRGLKWVCVHEAS